MSEIGKLAAGLVAALRSCNRLEKMNSLVLYARGEGMEKLNQCEEEWQKQREAFDEWIQNEATKPFPKPPPRHWCEDLWLRLLEDLVHNAIRFPRRGTGPRAPP